MLTRLTELASRLRAFFNARALDSELDEELQSHLTIVEDEAVRRGADPQQARHEARMKIGGAAQFREAHREARGLPLLDSLLRDARYALRSLTKSAGFTSAAVLTLGLGIGANTAIFSTIDETLFRPLDFPHPEQLADVFPFNKASQTFLSASYPDYEDLRARTQTFERLSAFLRMPMNIGLPNHSERLPVEAVTGNFFSMLRMPPVAGRTFREEDDAPAGMRVAMLSEEIASANSVGAKILIEDEPFTVIGIVPKRYHGTNLNWGDAPRVWIPLHAVVIVQPRFRALEIFHRRGMQWLVITGRLKPGVSAEHAGAEMQAITAGLARSEPATNRDLSAIVFSASRAKFWPSYRSSVTQSLTVFGVAAGLILLLTCANLSNLLLGRAASRQREFAIRLSIGASRGRLVRQLLTESLLLAVPSCAAALGIAWGLSKILAHFPNALGLPLALDGGVDYRVLCFCIALSISSAALFGLVPALQSTRPDVLPALKESGGMIAGGGGDRLRNMLLVLQVAFTMILLVAGGLFGRSVLSAWSVALGFRAEGLLIASFNSPALGSQGVTRLRLAQSRLTDRLQAVPGVESVALASRPPLSGVGFRAEVQSNHSMVAVGGQSVGPGFFHTLGIPLLSGRDFDAQDNLTAPKVAIVNQALAKRLWPAANPVGQKVTLRKDTLEVVGVVRDSRYGSVWEDPAPSLYRAVSQEEGPANYLIVHTRGNPADFAAGTAGEWNEIMPRMPLYDFLTTKDLMKVALAPQRMAAGVFAAFGLMAIVLACVGLYSTVAYAVARRTREMGIRLAIGAQPGALVWRILGKSMGVAGIGIAAGTCISALLTRFVASQVKGISVNDIATFAFVAGLLGLIAVIAAAIPARRAARIDPMAALRSE